MLALRLAVRDWLDEWPTSLALTVGVVAAAVPLMLMLSIRTGIVGQLRSELEAYASSRALVSIGQPIVKWADILALRARDDVAFAVPQTRLLTASAVLHVPGGPNVVVDLLPSGPGEPLVRNWRNDIIALSPEAAREARARNGDKIELIFDRITADGVTERATVTRKFSATINLNDSGRRFALLDLETLVASEIFREDVSVATLDQAREKARSSLSSRLYSGVRVFARDLDAVEGIRAFLLTRGIETDGRIDEIRLVRRLDSGLSIIIAVIAGLGTVGLCLSLAAAQWAWVERKRLDLSYLRLLGMAPASVMMFPIWQAMLVVGVGLGLATLAAAAGSLIVNKLLFGQLATVQEVSRLGIVEIAQVATLAILAGGAAALLAVRAVRRIESAETLRGA